MDVAGILLTGGGSLRMGVDKATLHLEGSAETLAQRTGRLLAAVAQPCIEVGPGYSGLPAVREDPPGAGPLVAVARGWEALIATQPAAATAGQPAAGRPVLVLAVDLPALDAETLQWLAARPEQESVVPVVDGHPQPLCARWSAADLDKVRRLVTQGHLAMRALVERCQPVLVESVRLSAFADADTPQAARLLGLAVPGGPAVRQSRGG